VANNSGLSTIEISAAASTRSRASRGISFSEIASPARMKLNSPICDTLAAIVEA